MCVCIFISSSLCSLDWEINSLILKVIVSLPKCQELNRSHVNNIGNRVQFRFDISHNMCVFYTKIRSFISVHWMMKLMDLFSFSFFFFTQYNRTLEAKNAVYVWLMAVWVDQIERILIDLMVAHTHTLSLFLSHDLCVQCCVNEDNINITY